MARFSASLFHCSSNDLVYLSVSRSIFLAQLLHSQIPLSKSFRASFDMLSSYLGPSGDAAHIWAASPILLGDCPFPGPDVGARQDGFEHLFATLCLRLSIVFLLKLSLFTFSAHQRKKICSPTSSLFIFARYFHSRPLIVFFTVIPSLTKPTNPNLTTHSYSRHWLYLDNAAFWSGFLAGVCVSQKRQI